MHLLGTLGSRFGNGFLDFYDVKTPFDPRVHTDMRGVILIAIFAFVVALGSLVASRKPLAALLVLLVGAGWPATLRGSAGALTVGVVILAAGLVLLAGLTNVLRAARRRPGGGSGCARRARRIDVFGGGEGRHRLVAGVGPLHRARLAGARQLRLGCELLRVSASRASGRPCSR